MSRPLFATLLFVTTISVALADDVDLSQCALCHGTNGNGNPAVRAPKISGLDAAYLRRQLEIFRAGWRGTHEADERGNEMRAVAASLTDDAAIDRAVAHVRSFEVRPPAPTVAGDVERGRTLYEQCAACHGARGEGNAAMQAPALANASDWYLLAQLRNYASGIRGTAEPEGPGTQMRAIALTLPDAQAASDVVAYINTLR
ncbi:cytochrome c553 [Povalibacter uvarum]|uniref:Cytochrome c553 n=1 Tax=Povalibacter uvarum TaxID=732238 RepID=A0A841HTU8_9GAMM|nr:c-type cytochrome [Povalibacter uvarum]MBB6096054.1 cytochrome c553 [Povalibacter uvarum]